MSETTDLDAQLAQRLFGWRWRADIDRWMTPDADPVLAQDLPAYSTAPAATALVWQWVETRVLISEICFPYHFNGKITPRHVRCEIVYRTGRKGAVYHCVKGTGATWPEALCRAALALAEALEGEHHAD